MAACLKKAPSWQPQLVKMLRGGIIRQPTLVEEGFALEQNPSLMSREPALP